MGTKEGVTMEKKYLEGCYNQESIISLSGLLSGQLVINPAVRENA